MYGSGYFGHGPGPGYENRGAIQPPNPNHRHVEPSRRDRGFEGPPESARVWNESWKRSDYPPDRRPQGPDMHYERDRRFDERRADSWVERDAYPSRYPEPGPRNRDYSDGWYDRRDGQPPQERPRSPRRPGFVYDRRDWERERELKRELVKPFEYGIERAPPTMDEPFLKRIGAKVRSDGHLVNDDGFTLRTRDPFCNAPSPPLHNPGRERRVREREAQLNQESTEESLKKNAQLQIAMMDNIKKRKIQKAAASTAAGPPKPASESGKERIANDDESIASPSGSGGRGSKKKSGQIKEPKDEIAGDEKREEGELAAKKGKIKQPPPTSVVVPLDFDYIHGVKSRKSAPPPGYRPPSFLAAPPRGGPSNVEGHAPHVGGPKCMSESWTSQYFKNVEMMKRKLGRPVLEGPPPKLGLLGSAPKPPSSSSSRGRHEAEQDEERVKQEVLERLKQMSEDPADEPDTGLQADERKKFVLFLTEISKKVGIAASFEDGEFRARDQSEQGTPKNKRIEIPSALISKKPPSAKKELSFFRNDLPSVRPATIRANAPSHPPNPTQRALSPPAATLTASPVAYERPDVGPTTQSAAGSGAAKTGPGLFDLDSFQEMAREQAAKLQQLSDYYNERFMQNGPNPVAAGAAAASALAARVSMGAAGAAPPSGHGNHMGTTIDWDAVRPGVPPSHQQAPHQVGYQQPAPAPPQMAPHPPLLYRGPPGFGPHDQGPPGVHYRGPHPHDAHPGPYGPPFQYRGRF